MTLYSRLIFIPQGLLWWASTLHAESARPLASTQGPHGKLNVPCITCHTTTDWKDATQPWLAAIAIPPILQTSARAAMPICIGAKTAPNANSAITPEFRVEFISGNTAYIDGGSNAGRRVGMKFDLRHADPNSGEKEQTQPTIGAARIVGIAKTSAILELGTSNGELKNMMLIVRPAA